MGRIEKRVPIPDWKEDLIILRILKSNLPKDARTVSVSLVVKRESYTRHRNFAEVVYKLGEKLYRSEFKLRDDRHWNTRLGRLYAKKRREETEGSHLTTSDILGEERVSENL